MICPTMKQCTCGHRHFHLLVDKNQIAAVCGSCGKFIVGSAAIRTMPDAKAEEWKFKIEEIKPHVDLASLLRNDPREH